MGKIIRLNKNPYPIAGLTPEEFHGTEKFIQPEVLV